MIIKEIKGYEYKVYIGDVEVKETLTDELSKETIDYIARIEETANHLVDNRYTEEEVQKEIMAFVEDLLSDMYHDIKESNGKIKPLEYINDMYKKYKGDYER